MNLCTSPSKANTRQTTSHTNAMLLLWSALHLIVFLALSGVVFVHRGHFFGTHNHIGEFNDLIKVASVFTTHLLVLLEAFAMRHQLHGFWVKMTEADSRICSALDSLHTRNSKAFYRFLGRKFFVHLTAVLVAEFIIIGSVQDDVLWTRIWSVTFLSVTVSRMRHLQLMLHMELIGHRLKGVRKALQQVVVQAEQQLHADVGKSLFRKVCAMKGIYNILFECCSHINFAFGLSQLLNLMQNFIQLTSDLYWLYSILYRNDLTYIFVLILALLPTLQVVIVMLSAGERCLEEVREIGYLLHNLDKDVDDRAMNTLVSASVFF